MKYKDYSADDLIKDEFFQQWVFSPTEESNRFWLDFLENYPDHRERVEEARQFLSFFHIKEKDVFEARVGNLKKRINFSVDDPQPVERPKQEEPATKPKLKFTRRKSIRIAALGAILLIGVIVAIYSFLPNEEKRKAHRFTSSGTEQVVFTKKGKRTVVTLPDGTKAWLNAESTITFPNNMDSLRSRTVKLSGQAFFQVSENLQKPFIVQIGEVNLVGYAASFDVRAYPSSKLIEVTVLTGRVRLEQKDQPMNTITISPDQSAVFEEATNNISIDNRAKANLVSAWRFGVIYFHERPFKDIKTTLERWYDVNLQVEDTTALNCYFSGELNNKTLRETLDMFVKDKPASFMINGTDVLIKGKLCDEQNGR